jgi:hypothetical protein
VTFLGSKERPFKFTEVDDGRFGENGYSYGLPPHEALMAWLRQPGRERIREVWVEPRGFVMIASCVEGLVRGGIYPAERFAFCIPCASGPVWVRCAEKDTVIE